MERAKKGDVVGTCRHCGAPLVYSGRGRMPRVCPRPACVRAKALARVRKHRGSVDKGVTGE